MGCMAWLLQFTGVRLYAFVVGVIIGELSDILLN
jgi:hypothetical protein